MKILPDSASATLDIAATATYTSDVFVLEHCFSYSIHAKWTKVAGTVGGTFKTFKSNDGAYWIEVSSTNISDASGAKDLEVVDVAYRYLKYVCTLTGGSVTFQGETFIKGF